MAKSIPMIPGLLPSKRERRVDPLREFLWLTADLPVEEAAAIAGVSVPTISRWRRSGAQKVRESIRRRLVRYVKSRQAPEAARRAA